MNKGEHQELFTIRVVAEMLDVHQQTLRLYEREGLITPERTPGRTPGRTRCSPHASLKPNYRALSCLISIVHRWTAGIPPVIPHT